LDERALAGFKWSRAALGQPISIVPLAGDASFRRYFRVRSMACSYVLMDAPPEREDVGPFLNVRAWLEGAGVRAPRLVAEDGARGFLLLEDFGDVTWAAHVQEGHAPDALVADALRQLHRIQANVPPFALPAFDLERMHMECDLYLDWYLLLVAGHKPRQAQRQAFYDGINPVLNALLALPQAPVHLDYHSRNLMLPGGDIPLGVIDFQDAVTGPVTYDLACDLYLDWYLLLVAGHKPRQAQRQAFYDGINPVLNALLALPQAPVHLDYHSRNLMLPGGDIPLGVIDFQDAVTGPVTYDLASLLYDCYQDYPENLRRQWSGDFFHALAADLQACFTDFEDWHRAVRLTAMQRHIKAIGIFARLAHRDGKRRFLDEIPLARKHLYEEMQALPAFGNADALLLMEPA